ncbi:MAG: hypothetical protein HYZ49_09990 [Chloroflexi bacterium]|nr:hypothetical protein [Chloroflexota bacterium]
MQPDPSSPFASVVGLGAFKSDHSPAKSGRWINVIFSGLIVVAGPVLLLVAAFMAYNAYTRYGISKVDDSGFILPLICGVIAVPLGLYGLYSAWRNWPLAAALYDNGFAYNDRNGFKQVRWDNIDAVWQNITKHYRNGIYTGTTYLYTVQTKDKQRIVLDNKFKKIEDLGNAIISGSATALFPRYLQALQQGQRLTFGPLAIDPNGIYSGNKSLRWDEIKGIKIHRGTISVKKEGGWFNWATAGVPQIPNFLIFYNLIGRLTKVE